MHRNRKLSDGFGSIQRPKSINEMTYERLRSGVLTGKLAVGDFYNELELAKELGVSRTPVREALLKLAAENLIVFHPGKGITVNHFTKKDIEDLFELRQAIEEAAIARVMENLSEEQIQTAKNLIAQQEDCTKSNYDENLFLEIDRRFHLFLVGESGNRFMVQTYNNIRDYITITAREALAREGRAGQVIQEHKAIVRALSQRKTRAIKHAIRKHLMSTKLTAMKYHDQISREEYWDKS